MEISLPAAGSVQCAPKKALTRKMLMAVMLAVFQKIQVPDCEHEVKEAVISHLMSCKFQFHRESGHLFKTAEVPEKLLAFVKK